MESMIDTNGKSPQIAPGPQATLGRMVGLGQLAGLGKREIISGFAMQGQVRRRNRTKWLFVVIGLVCGCDQGTASRVHLARVTGASMAPTIWGDHGLFSCSGCEIQWKVNWQPEMRPRGTVRCWNCGQELTTSEILGRSGDMVRIDPAAYLNEAPEMDDIVAIGDPQGVRIKRVVGIPGQVISSRDGILFRDHAEMTSSAPWLVVHDDSFRAAGDSWWQSNSPTQIRQTEKGFDINVDPSKDPSVRLTYHHRSAYQQLRPDRVRDDYPANLAESRQLREVETLAVQGEFSVRAETVLHCWNWTSQGVFCRSLRLLPGRHRLDIRWSNAADPTLTAPAELSAEHPICLIIGEGSGRIGKLKVMRPVHYWIHAADAQKLPLPLTIRRDQYFLIGDNVPLSIDSRQTGPVARMSILGKALATADELTGR